MYKDGKTATGDVDDKVVKEAVKRIEAGELSLRSYILMLRDAEVAQEGVQEALRQQPLTGPTMLKIKKMMQPFFLHYDKNRDNEIDITEFRMLLGDLNESADEATANKLFKKADLDGGGKINFDEFVMCIVTYATTTGGSFIKEEKGPRRVATCLLGGEEEEEPEEEDMPDDLCELPHDQQQKLLKSRAFQGMGIGTALVLVFSDPMVDCLSLLGVKLGVPAFYISFLLAPLASNAAELVSAMKIARKRTPGSMVQALCSLEGAAIMNNTFCLAIFLGLIIAKDLVWQFSAEAMSILVIQVLIAALVLAKGKHIVMDGFFIMAFYPVALMVVYVLEGMGWD